MLEREAISRLPDWLGTESLATAEHIQPPDELGSTTKLENSKGRGVNETLFEKQSPDCQTGLEQHLTH